MLLLLLRRIVCCCGPNRCGVILPGVVDGPDDRSPFLSMTVALNETARNCQKQAIVDYSPPLENQSQITTPDRPPTAVQPHAHLYLSPLHYYLTFHYNDGSRSECQSHKRHSKLPFSLRQGRYLLLLAPRSSSLLLAPPHPSSSSLLAPPPTPVVTVK